MKRFMRIFIEDFILESCLHDRCCSHGLEPTPKAKDSKMMTAKSNDYHIWRVSNHHGTVFGEVLVGTEIPGGGERANYIECKTVTTRMISALRWAEIRAF